MQRYPVSREAQKELDLTSLKSKMAQVFEVEPTTSGQYLVAAFGALKEIRVGFEDKRLLVETVTEPKAAEGDQVLTIKRYNQFLELATGFTSKERAKRLQAEAKKGMPA